MGCYLVNDGYEGINLNSYIFSSPSDLKYDDFICTHMIFDSLRNYTPFDKFERCNFLVSPPIFLACLMLENGIFMGPKIAYDIWSWKVPEIVATMQVFHELTLKCKGFIWRFNKEEPMWISRHEGIPLDPIPSTIPSSVPHIFPNYLLFQKGKPRKFDGIMPYYLAKDTHLEEPFRKTLKVLN